ncbi:putative GDSL-like lipase/acylhydrolase [Emericellopsis atlantica]|uniref:GDSL-like lipase/acylhydrolase n=1 Tax=Emericellopsis atlantica TaxID=2614577 RepID=A0A9P7ZD63_9HYPO|nr:putative GDSL-like lipase/acylhydrolase [Emericellopsis atlantica]KAG9249652.1 putative GDSL-like lipase/acylhydrolase [Emericellopsis atlantica]
MTSRPCNILCFGDSLTSGYCDWGYTSHPYSICLQDRIAQELPPGTRFEVFTNGEPGECAGEDSFRSRLEVELEKRTYDWVIMLGGTNDLGSFVSPEDIFQALHDHWHRVLRKGCKILALTIPECGARHERLDRARKIVNDRIMSYQAENYHAFDLRSHIPYHSLTEDEQDTLWDDGLHLTVDGYNWMGAHIADAFIPLLKQDLQKTTSKDRYSSSKPSSAARRPTKYEDDDRVFEEEGDGADKRDIKAGYVVVRKRDLE